VAHNTKHSHLPHKLRFEHQLLFKAQNSANNFSVGTIHGIFLDQLTGQGEKEENFIHINITEESRQERADADACF
jgi:hypothetical protein